MCASFSASSWRLCVCVCVLLLVYKQATFTGQTGLIYSTIILFAAFVCVCVLLVVMEYATFTGQTGLIYSTHKLTYPFTVQMFTTSYLLLTIYSLLFTPYNLLLTIYSFPLLTNSRTLLQFKCLLLPIYYLLFTPYYLLLSSTHELTYPVTVQMSTTHTCVRAVLCCQIYHI